MKPSSTCIHLIKSFEGLRLKPYLDSARIPTIGYGTIRYPNSKRVTMNDSRITEEQAFEFFINDVNHFTEQILPLIRVNLSQNQFDAIVSFTYNVGIGALKSSTLLKKLNHDPNDSSIHIEFQKWCKAGGKVIPGLLNRRNKESTLYFTK